MTKEIDVENPQKCVPRNGLEQSDERALLVQEPNWIFFSECNEIEVIGVNGIIPYDAPKNCPDVSFAIHHSRS